MKREATLRRVENPCILTSVRSPVVPSVIMPPAGRRSHQSCPFLSSDDIAQAIYFAWDWIAGLIRQVDLRVAKVDWPSAPGAELVIFLVKDKSLGGDAGEITPPPTILGY